MSSSQQQQKKLAELSERQTATVGRSIYQKQSEKCRIKGKLVSARELIVQSNANVSISSSLPSH